ncbi:MAG: sulfur carrier protein ThiS [Pseudomonadota bacterium]
MRSQITVNGETRPWQAVDVVRLLQAEGLDPARRGVAVAINGAVVPRHRWAETAVQPNDLIEIVKPFAGG